MSHKVAISLLAPKSITNIALEKSLNIQELAEEITKGNWCPALFKDKYRTIANAKQSDLFVLDVDSGCTIEEAKEKFKDHWHIIGTSRSHQLEKKTKGGTVYPACDRFRVVLLLDKPLANDLECKKTFKYLQDEYGFLDEACKDISRLFYPCTKIVSVNDDILGTVRDCSTDPDPDGREVKIQEAPKALVNKGKLLSDNMDFFLRGAPHGTRNTMLFQAASDAKEQGYAMDEVIEMVQDCGKKNDIDGFFPEIAAKHMATLNRVYQRPSTNPVRVAANPEEVKTFVSISDLMSQTWEYLNDKETIRGDSTGLPGLDDLFGGGFRLGEVTVLQGEAKTGKNTLYHQIQFFMLQRGIGQGYASRELDPAEEVLPNYLSLLTGKNAWTGEFSKEENIKATSQMASWPIYFMPGYGSISWDEIKAWMDVLSYRGIKHFWFDHLHYMLDDEDYKAASKLMKNIKTYAKTNKVHINLIVQPTKIGRDEQVGLNSLKGGAAVGQALDNLLLYTRSQPSDAAAPIQNCSTLELSHGRHKLAKPGKIYLQYDPITTRYAEVRALPTPPRSPGSKSEAYNNFSKNIVKGINNKSLVNQN